MTDKNWTRIWRIVAAVALALAGFATTLGGISLIQPDEPPVAAGAQASVPCYREVGGSKWIAGDGCEWEMQSGSTLDIQSGATSSFGGDLSITGGLDVDGATTLNSTLDADGATTLNSTLDVDGATTLNSTLDVDGNISSGTGAITMTDNVLVDGAADAIQLQVQGYTTQTNSLAVFEQSDGTDAATLSDAGLLTLAGGLSISDGDAVVADDLRITAQTVISVTDAAAFTPTGTYQPIQNLVAEVTPTITAGATAGDLVVIINTSSNTINIADSGTTMLSAAAALGQYDVLVLMSDGTNWLELSRSDN